MVRTTFVLLSLSLMVWSYPAQGQSKTGTTIGQFLLVEPSARAAGMGNAGGTMFDEVSAAFYNPGALGRMPQSDAQFTHSTWLAGITYNHAAVGVRISDASTLMLAVTALNSGEMEVRTVEQPLGTGERFSVKDLALGLGYGRRITDRFSAGMQVKYVQETIWHSQMSAFAVDFGVLYQLPFGTYIGASLSNFGTRGQFDGRDLRIRFDRDPDRFGDNSSLPAAMETEDFPLPIYFRASVGMPVTLGSTSTLHLSVDAFQPSDNAQSISLGAEWMFMEVVALRAGYQNLFLEETEAGLTLGAGLQYAISEYGFQFDYAWNDFGMLGDAQRFTVGLSF